MLAQIPRLLGSDLSQGHLPPGIGSGFSTVQGNTVLLRLDGTQIKDPKNENKVLTLTL